MFLKKIYNRDKENTKKIENLINAKNNDWIQRIVLKIWDVDPAVYAFHDISKGFGYEGTIIDFMSIAVIETFKRYGWRIRYYFNEELDARMPILSIPGRPEIKFPIPEEND